jgi:hypothetical protein
MPARKETERRGAEERVETHPGHVFGREWWGFDRDRLENELARQEASEARERAAEIKPH